MDEVPVPIVRRTVRTTEMTCLYLLDISGAPPVDPGVVVEDEVLVDEPVVLVVLVLGAHGFGNGSLFSLPS